jgi:hypothetical protein
MRLKIHALAKSSQSCCDFKSAACDMYFQRIFTTLVLVLTLPCLCPAQDAPSEEASPTPSPTPATTPEAAPASEPTPSPETSPAPETAATLEATPTPEATPRDQDFINLPTDTPPQASDVISGSQISLSGENLPTEQSDKEFLDPNQLLPTDSAPPAIDPRTLAASGEEQERKVKIRYQQVRAKAELDPDVASLLAKAKTARTFEGERAAYRKYYELLFKKMKKLDSTLAKKCDLMEKAYLSRLAQTRIEPTIPLEPPPKPEPLAN